jgi:hypothetical protein
MKDKKDGCAGISKKNYQRAKKKAKLWRIFVLFKTFILHGKGIIFAV